jgi:hypothetical protein
MNAHLIRPLIMGVFAFPLFVAAQQGSEGLQGPAGIPAAGTEEAVRYSDPGNNFTSNVPFNELSPKAYRRFHRRFPEVPTGEFWFKYAEGYQVSFTLDRHHQFAYFAPSGTFLYSLKYFDGKDLPRDMETVIKRRFPDYKIDVVTEVNDGLKTFYLLQIVNPDKIKMLTFVDGRIDVVNELHNGGANIGPAEAAR